MTTSIAGASGTLLERFMEPEDMKPNLAPTAIDIINFKKKLATALSKCLTRDHKVGGHVYLILDTEEYKEKVHNPDAECPKAPTNPILRDGTKDDPISSIEYKIHEKKEAIFNDHYNYDQQTKEIY